ncbi:MAG: dihydropteroate synthase [Candidatus Omnitrophica bacterium]|nr:dihydropteroate synthase [Candidatus Omnitrophota bacterium]
MVLVCSVRDSKNLANVMRDIHVDHFGIKIMLPKALSYAIKVSSVSNIAANILKQQMLSLGGDVAVARGALTGKTKKTDCLIMANLLQLKRLCNKLKKQPFGLGTLSSDIGLALKNYQRDKFTIDLGRYKLSLGGKSSIMGILNLTPDSFSGDGWFKTHSKGFSAEALVDFAQKMVEDGADIIDVGGESTRPGARPVSIKEELSRTIPVIKVLTKKVKVPISIDTFKPEVAKQALDNGVNIVNDISGLKNPKMCRVIAKYKAGAVMMHMKGNPQTMQTNPQYANLIDEISAYLQAGLFRAQDYGIDIEKLIIDPGLGFGKTFEHNLEILNNLGDFKVLGRPILVGPSRKSFIGKILGKLPKERLPGTISACVLAVKNGASIVRVHDIKEVSEALKVSDAINKI